MAGGTFVDFKVYDEHFQAGFWEGVQQQTDAFNAASGGTIVLENFGHKGHFLGEAFDQLTDAMRIRTISSVADVSDTKMTQAENIGVKLNWAQGPVAMTRDSYLKAGRDPALFSFILGQQLGELVPQHQLNAALAALFGSIVVTSAAFTTAVYDQSALSGTQLPTYKGLVASLGKLGDRLGNVAAWVMDGASYAALMGDAIGTYVTDNVAGALIANGTTHSLGKPVVVTDSSYLKVDPTSVANDRSIIYGLVPNAVRVRISEPPISLVLPVLGKQNIMYRFQAEGAYTINIRGAAYSTTTHNPALSDLAADNWTMVSSSVKGGPGVAIKTDKTF